FWRHHDLGLSVRLSCSSFPRVTKLRHVGIPSRFIDDGRARAAHGERVDRIAPYLMRADPLADAVADAFDEMKPREGFAQVERALDRGIARVPDAHPAVAALFREVEHVPAWVDFGAIDRAGELLFRSGAFGGLILGLQAL